MYISIESDSIRFENGIFETILYLYQCRMIDVLSMSFFFAHILFMLFVGNDSNSCTLWQDGLMKWAVSFSDILLLDRQQQCYTIQRQRTCVQTTDAHCTLHSVSHKFFSIIFIACFFTVLSRLLFTHHRFAMAHEHVHGKTSTYVLCFNYDYEFTCFLVDEFVRMNIAFFVQIEFELFGSPFEL